VCVCTYLDGVVDEHTFDLGDDSAILLGDLCVCVCVCVYMVRRLLPHIEKRVCTYIDILHTHTHTHTNIP
jgi:hypothetical protein